MSPFNRSVSILAVGLSKDLCALAGQAAREVWTNVELLSFPSLPGAEAHPAQAGMEILLLGGDVAAAERERAPGALAPDGLPRWPVVVLGHGVTTDAWWFVAPGPQALAELARIFPLAAGRHAAMRDTLRARGDLWTMARRISHEMRSPLGCILTSADVIREELGEVVPSAGALAQPIIDSAHELMHLLDRLTLVARASVMPPAAEPVDTSMILWAVRERLSAQINASGAELIEPDDWPPAIGRAEWLERVWHNLVENALRHAGPRPRIELGWRRRDGLIRYHVRDHGPGVAPDVVPTLFRPFHQLHQSDSGRGLGLSIVQRLIELHGGYSGYEAAKPHGACFFFALPEESSGGGVEG
jgi:signal transduction histidine kinase